MRSVSGEQSVGKRYSPRHNVRLWIFDGDLDFHVPKSRRVRRSCAINRISLQLALEVSSQARPLKPWSPTTRVLPSQRPTE